jgi:hypothetical protein
MDISEVILNLVPRKKGGVRTSAVQEIRLQNYSVLFMELCFFWGGGVRLAMAAIVTLAENRWQ